MNTFTLADLEKAIAYARKNNAEVVQLSMEHSDMYRLRIQISEAYKGAASTIIVYCAESKKMPVIIKEETLF